MASGVCRIGVVVDVAGDVCGDVIAVALSEVVPSRTRNHRRDQCLVRGGEISNVHAPANESVPTNRTRTLKAVLKTAQIMSVIE